MGTRCELRVRELGTPSSSTESYCHRLPDLHSCPHFGDLKIEGVSLNRGDKGKGIWLGFGSKMQRKWGQCNYYLHLGQGKWAMIGQWLGPRFLGYYLHLGQGKWQPGQESSRQSHKSRPECSKTPWDIAHLTKQDLDRWWHFNILLVSLCCVTLLS